MKLNRKWLVGEIFLALIALAGMVLLCTLHNIDLPTKGFAYTFTGLITAACCICVFTAKFGEVYYQYFTLSKEELITHIYENMIVIAYHDYAWTYNQRIDEIHALKEIKLVQLYNGKKECVKWYPIPYQQLDEMKVDEKMKQKAEKKVGMKI